jgi:hypothetical protein
MSQAAVAALGIAPYLLLKDNPLVVPKSYRMQFVKLFERIKLNAVWRVVLFKFLASFFSNIANAASYDVANQWCHVLPWVEVRHVACVYMYVFMYVCMTYENVWMRVFCVALMDGAILYDRSVHRVCFRML